MNTFTRPILFSAPMVRALLDGSKTQTRRVIKLPPAPMTLGTWEPTTVGGHGSVDKRGVSAPEMAAIWHTRTGTALTCPYGQPGDRLWVRETWQHSNDPYGPYDSECDVFYRADYMDDPHGPDGELSPEGRYRRWRPSIHMPRIASRIDLEIVSLRVEKLQAISEVDAQAEGATYHKAANHLCHAGWSHDGHYLHETALASFGKLWESINGAGSWAANPWVWVVEFERVAP